MPSMKVMQKCDFCKKIMATMRGIEKHEAQCLYNPEGKNCFMCSNAYQGTGYTTNYDGSEVEHNGVPICHFTEDIIHENTALSCEDFKRSKTMYYFRETKEVPNEADNHS